MISNKVIFLSLIFIFCLASFCFSKVESNDEEIVYDANSLPVFKLDNNETSVSYYLLEIKDVSTDISYIGGYNALSTFCDSIYYEWMDSLYVELNAKALYTILFNSNMKIVEIRIVKRVAYNNNMFNYDELIKNILRKSEGNWKKGNFISAKGNEWFFYSGFFNLR